MKFVSTLVLGHYGKEVGWHFLMYGFSTPPPNDMRIRNSPKRMKSTKKRKREDILNVFFKLNMAVLHPW